MSEHPLQPHSIPTMYFIGVTTGKSSMVEIFPRWSEILHLGAQLVGYDAPLNAPASVYRDVVEHIKHDAMTRGGLVTTHKIDLLAATHDLFDYLDEYAALCGEVSCIAKREDGLHGIAVDPVSSGAAWRGFVPTGHWSSTGGQVLCLGAGGAAAAISLYAAGLPAADRPTHFTIVDISWARLEHIQRIHKRLGADLSFEYILNDSAAQNDALMTSLPRGSMVINATGMGKDRPGSPITERGVFPLDGLVWELNYRGELTFLHQAGRQGKQRGLHIEDGWVYFLHGWTQVMAQIFQFELTPGLFVQLDRAASSVRV